MKKAIFILLLLASYGGVLSAQNFRLFITSRAPFFEAKISQHSIISSKIDSSIVVGTDTLFYCLRSPEGDLYSECDNPHYSKLGYAVTEKSNGTTILLTRKEMPVLIKQRDPLGSSWTLYTLSNGWYIKGTITLIDTATFLEITDTVKHIALQLYNSQHTPVPSNINSRKFVISKLHGLLEFPDYYIFPVSGSLSSKYYTLVGFNNPETGITSCLGFFVHDYEIGDQIHINSDDGPGWGYQIKKEVIGKVVKTDTVIYTFSECRFSYHGITHRLHTDTITLSDNYPFYPNQPIFSIGKSKRFYRGLESTLQFNGRKQQVFRNTDYYACTENSTLWEGIVNTADYEVFYVEGLGGPYVFDHHGTVGEILPVYYKKGAEEWGTPLTWDCEDGEQYSPVRTDGRYYFTDSASSTNADTLLLTVNTGSFLVNGTDTTYQIIPSIAPLQPNTCTDFESSWLGKTLTYSNDGSAKLKNFQNIDLIFSRFGKNMDYWHFYEDTATGLRFNAMTGTPDTITLFGQDEPVKVIHLQAYNGYTAVASAYNNKTITVSRNHGIVESFDLLNFPDESFAERKFTLVGSGKDSLGIKPDLGQSVYVFSPGDQFHITHLYGNDSITRIIRNVLTSEVVNDTVYNSYLDCMNFEPSGLQLTIQAYDTIGPQQSWQPFPGQVSTTDTTSVYFSVRRDPAQYNSRMKKEFNFLHWDVCHGDSSWINPTAGATRYYAVDGCGGWYYESADTSFLLTGYKKGTEEWGTFHTLDCASPLPSSNGYSLITTGHELLFGDVSKDGSKLMALAIDQVLVLGNDSLFQLSPNPLPVDSCYTRQTSIAGESILMKASDGSVMIQGFGKNYHLFPRFGGGMAWEFMKPDDETRFIARVATIAVDTVLGVVDSIKTIRINYFSSSMIPLEHSWNNQTISLSQNHGMTGFFNYLSPEPGSGAGQFLQQYKVEGRNNPPSGITANMTFAKDSLFVDDVFHVFNNSDHEVYTITRVTSRTTTDTTIVYVLEICEKDLTANIDTSYQKTDTVRLDYGFQFLPSVLLTNGMQTISLIAETNDFNGRLCKKTNVEYWENCIQDSIFIAPLPDSINGYYEYAVKGAGSGYWNSESGIGRNLIYFKKGSEEWGTPLFADCGILLSANVNLSANLINIYPNPSGGEATLTLQNKSGAKFFLYMVNPNGDILLTFEALPGFNRFGIPPNLPPSLYCIYGTDQNGSVVRAKYLKVK